MNISLIEVYIRDRYVHTVRGKMLSTMMVVEGILWYVMNGTDPKQADVVEAYRMWSMALRRRTRTAVENELYSEKLNTHVPATWEHTLSAEEKTR